MELATIYCPPAFLPLACTANLAKNLAAVAASSTRAPIYRTFALQNNLADITAKVGACQGPLPWAGATRCSLMCHPARHTRQEQGTH